MLSCKRMLPPTKGVYMRFFEQHPYLRILALLVLTAIEIAFLVTGLPVLPAIAIMLNRFIDSSPDNGPTRSLN